MSAVYLATSESESLSREEGVVVVVVIRYCPEERAVRQKATLTFEASGVAGLLMGSEDFGKELASV